MRELPKVGDVDRAELTRKDVHHPVQAAKRFMIDQSHSSRKGPDPTQEDDAGLEEARLRQQAIGVKLRHMFDVGVRVPVPDDFLDILRKADKKAEGGS